MGINEIGLIYQALGYEVLLVTKYNNSNEHFATRTVSNFESIYGINPHKTIAIIDEHNYYDDNFQDIIKFFTEAKIPYVGFVNYEK